MKGVYIDWLNNYQLPNKDCGISYRTGSGNASVSHLLTGSGISGFEASKSSTWVFCGILFAQKGCSYMQRFSFTVARDSAFAFDILIYE
jgi:hypothetical protein